MLLIGYARVSTDLQNLDLQLDKPVPPAETAAVADVPEVFEAPRQPHPTSAAAMHPTSAAAMHPTSPAAMHPMSAAATHPEAPPTPPAPVEPTQAP